MLKVKNVTKIYGIKSSKKALDTVSLAVPEGSFFGLLGPNGAGKSTLIHCITGISQPDKGTIHVDGVDVVNNYRTARTKVGLSAQEFNVDIFSTPLELLDYMGGYYGVPSSVRRSRIDTLIHTLDLGQHQHMKFQQLSGGLKRRVVIARALIHEPKLLILDEPTAGVDVEQRHQLWQYLKDLNSRGTTIILTSHYIEEVQHLCEQIAVINKGVIILNDTKDNLLSNTVSLEDRYLEIIHANNKT